MKKATGKLVKTSSIPAAIWILSYRTVEGEHFCGSYPSSQEAEQAQLEEFALARRAFSIIGYSPELLDKAFVSGRR